MQVTKGIVTALSFMVTALLPIWRFRGRNKKGPPMGTLWILVRRSG